MNMDPRSLIERYYASLPEARNLLLAHSEAVARKALELADTVTHLNPDRRFIEEAALLHDIGILHTNAPALGCRGEYAYIVHGHIGWQMLQDEGLPRHALVCLRHVGVGLTAQDIANNGWDMPHINMFPETLEEKIVSFADKFFSKKPLPLAERPIEEVRATVASWGAEKLAIFDEWCALFGVILPEE